MDTEDIVFHRLEAEDIPVLTPYFLLRSNITCDSTIFDSYLWKDFYEVEFAAVDGKAILFRMVEDGVAFGALPLCRDEDMPYYYDLLEEYFEKVMKRPFRIYGADEAAVKLLDPDPERYEVIEQTDENDYIYDGESLRTLAGRRYHKKKNNLNAFLRSYEGRWEYRELGAEAADEIWEFLQRWEETRDADEEAGLEEHLDAEIHGLQNYLAHMDLIPASMAGIYLDGRLEAFTIGTYNPVDRMSVVHVEKANHEIRGLYTLINQQFQLHAFPDALLVNREDDVGLPGLRKAKESYHPVRMGRKFEIRKLYDR